MDLHINVANQSKTPLYLMNPTKYMLLAAYSTLMSVIINNRDEMRVGTTLDYSLGLPLPLYPNGTPVYSMVIIPVSTSQVTYICLNREEKSTITNISYAEDVFTWSFPGVEIDAPGASCITTAIGAWNFTSKEALGYADAILIVAPEPPPAEDQGQWTSWLLVLLAVLLIVGALIAILYFSLRGQDSPPAE